MDCYDHFPWLGSADEVQARRDAIRAAQQRGALVIAPVTPPPFAPQTTAPVVAPVTRRQDLVARRYGHTYCLSCGLEIFPANYCACPPHPPPVVTAQDGASSDLERRIAEAQRVRTTP
jgi:hypothetical protein